MSNTNLLYTDISPEMDMSWNRDVAKTVGNRAVKNALIGIVMTRKGSKPFNPEFGCDISDQLFENMSPLTANTLEQVITSAIRKFEPRVLELAVGVTSQYDSNAVVVNIQFSILDNPDELETLKLKLYQ